MRAALTNAEKLRRPSIGCYRWPEDATGVYWSALQKCEESLCEAEQRLHGHERAEVLRERARVWQRMANYHHNEGRKGSEECRRRTTKKPADSTSRAKNGCGRLCWRQLPIKWRRTSRNVPRMIFWSAWLTMPSCIRITLTK